MAEGHSTHGINAKNRSTIMTKTNAAASTPTDTHMIATSESVVKQVKYLENRTFSKKNISGTQGLEIFGLFPTGDCEAVAGGRVVVSVEGDPSKYSFV